MTDCPGCFAAEQNRLSGLIYADCLSCAARSLAKSHAYFDAVRSETITPAYRDVLQLIFGEQWRDGHAAAKAWSAKLAGVKA